jgi:dCTP deaminase
LRRLHDPLRPRDPGRFGEGAIRITPAPPADHWSSTAVDLRLDEQLSFWEVPSGDGAHVHFSPHDPDYDYNRLKDAYAKTATLGDAGRLLAPHDFVLGWTIEKLQLPYQSRLAARVEGKSGLARLGMGVHVTAPTIHAGFGYKDDVTYLGSPIQLEIWNVGPIPILLKRGMRICQLIFEVVDGTPEQGYAGQFSIQGPQTS